jgi:hypothetical protein
MTPPAGAHIAAPAYHQGSARGYSLRQATRARGWPTRPPGSNARTVVPAAGMGQ